MLCCIQNKSSAYLPVSPPAVPPAALPGLAAPPASSLLPCPVPQYLPDFSPSSVRSAPPRSFESPLQISSACLFPPASTVLSADAAHHKENSSASRAPPPPWRCPTTESLTFSLGPQCSTASPPSSGSYTRIGRTR